MTTSRSTRRIQYNPLSSLPRETSRRYLSTDQIRAQLKSFLTGQDEHVFLLLKRKSDGVLIPLSVKRNCIEEDDLTGRFKIKLQESNDGFGKAEHNQAFADLEQLHIQYYISVPYSENASSSKSLPHEISVGGWESEFKILKIQPYTPNSKIRYRMPYKE